MPRVSIIIPAFNAVATIHETLDSVLQQTVRDIEIIVVDDGSTDATAAAVMPYLGASVTLVQQPNKGLSAARNTGIAHATGELLLFLDADDLILPDYLACQVSVLTAHPETCVACCDFRYFPDGFPQQWRPHSLAPVQPYPLSQLLAGNVLPVHTAVVRRTTIDRVGPFDESLTALEDWDLWLRIALDGGRFQYHPRILALYRQRAGSLSKSLELNARCAVQVLDKFRDHIGDEAQLAAWQWSRHCARQTARWALGLYEIGDYESGRQQLAAAVMLDDQWLASTDELAEWVVNTAVVHGPETGEAIVHHFTGDLAALAPRMGRFPDTALGNFWAACAFDAHRRNNRARVRQCALWAMRTDRRWRTERGLLSILSQAVIGRRVHAMLRPRSETAV